jgi:hypothetical protein
VDEEDIPLEALLREYLEEEDLGQGEECVARRLQDGKGTDGAVCVLVPMAKWALVLWAEVLPRLDTTTIKECHRRVILRPTATEARRLVKCSLR